MSILSVNNPITNCPQAHGTLRKIQQAKTKVLFAFDRFCKENGLAYWLHAGTHLGAVRHGGFIPWDDDIDVAMMRDDFDRFIGIVGRMPQNGKIRYYWCGGFIKIKYTEKDFVLDAVDVFPFHQYYKRTDISDAGKLKQRIAEYITPNHILSAPLLEMPYHGTCAEMKTMREKIMEGKSPVVDGDIFAVNCNKNIFRYEWIFPLSVIPFEGRKLSAPNNADNVLESQFGDFMAYPPDMYFGHGSVSDNLMHNWRNYEKLDGFLSMDAAFIYELMAGVKK
jgi:lipopolysaccharide cholinephosphotransferase